MGINTLVWMTLAIEQAKQAQQIGEVPVGAILVQNNKLIAGAHNQTILNNDPTAHAEIQLLRIAGKKLNNYRLSGTTLYVTLEPCTMCLGAIVHARISCIVFGAYDKKSGACGSCINLLNNRCFNHLISIKSGILADQCKNLLQNFFKNKRRNTQ
ncbi:MAG: tRNA adenosine(34) deaminase TadA [Candidatus Vesicomyosocius endoextente]|uniref:tRNA-specific adenosine deaminase n=1 Tax=Candidatus Vesicomyosocius endoextente TaxID=2738853 RepID=A0A853G9Q9_9GAMM|nr:tRNA adenosine(34) deaminase TadA [Candidatus Vesicomyosocius endoextente]